MHQFHDIVVAPYSALLGAGTLPGVAFQGGPHWPDFASQTVVRHCRRGRPADRAPQPVAEPITPLSGRFAWGGGLVPHFGHQLIDHSMRLGPTLMTEPDISFLFAVHANSDIRTWSDAPDFFKGIVSWFGLDESRVRIVHAPRKVDTLAVAPQAEQDGLADPAASTYLDYLDTLTARRLPDNEKTGVVYVSRSRVAYHYAGEPYIDQVFSEAGIRVMHPETMPFEEQLRAYRRASRLVLAEGSTLHALQVLGRGLGHIRVVQRRFDTIAPWIRPALDVRGTSVDFVNALKGVLQPAGVPGSIQTWRGMGIFDEEQWLAAIPELLGDDVMAGEVKRRWSPTEFSRAVEADILAWATGLPRGRSVAFPETVPVILAQLVATGLGHLSGAVEQCLR